MHRRLVQSFILTFVVIGMLVCKPSFACFADQNLSATAFYPPVSATSPLIEYVSSERVPNSYTLRDIAWLYSGNSLSYSATLALQNAPHGNEFLNSRFYLTNSNFCLFISGSDLFIYCYPNYIKDDYNNYASRNDFIIDSTIVGYEPRIGVSIYQGLNPFVFKAYKNSTWSYFYGIPWYSTSTPVLYPLGYSSNSFSGTRYTPLGSYDFNLKASFRNYSFASSLSSPGDNSDLWIFHYNYNTKSYNFYNESISIPLSSSLYVFSTYSLNLVPKFSGDSIVGYTGTVFSGSSFENIAPETSYFVPYDFYGTAPSVSGAPTPSPTSTPSPSPSLSPIPTVVPTATSSPTPSPTNAPVVVVPGDQVTSTPSPIPTVPVFPTQNPTDNSFVSIFPGKVVNDSGSLSNNSTYTTYIWKAFGNDSSLVFHSSSPFRCREGLMDYGTFINYSFPDSFYIDGRYEYYLDGNANEPDSYFILSVPSSVEYDFEYRPDPQPTSSPDIPGSGGGSGSGDIYINVTVSQPPSFQDWQLSQDVGDYVNVGDSSDGDPFNFMSETLGADSFLLINSLFTNIFNFFNNNFGYVWLTAILGFALVSYIMGFGRKG